MVTGASNVSNAMAYGKQAARSIDLELMETDRWPSLFPEIGYSQIPPREPSATFRNEGAALPSKVRASCSEEVVARLSHEETLEEACRCLRCDVKAVKVG